jgi:uncharacterized SAM-binding protein YcdF (DUF218 family)
MLSPLLVATVLALWLLHRGRSLDSRWRVAGWLAVAGALGLGMALAPPVVLLRKMVGVVVMPPTLIWIAMAALVVRSWREPQWRWLLLALFGAYSIATCPWTAYLLLRSLERPFEEIRPLEDPTVHTAVMVMGGGTSALPSWDSRQPQLGTSGDRVRLAAALYVAGRTPVLVTSGASIDGARDISAETVTLWAAMGVSPAAVVRLPRPRNSVEEIGALAALVEDRGWPRVGLVTSARHLPRALAICRRRAIACDPLPADFRAEKPARGIYGVMPSAEAFAGVESAAWEYVGLLAVRLVGG